MANRGYAPAMADSTFLVERSITIDAPPAQIYPAIADFHQWPQWSPWEDVDPHLKRTYSGPTAGRGAHYAWSGNRKAGSGTMDITGATEPSQGRDRPRLREALQVPQHDDVQHPAGRRGVAGHLVDDGQEAPGQQADGRIVLDGEVPRARLREGPGPPQGGHAARGRLWSAVDLRPPRRVHPNQVYPIS